MKKKTGEVFKRVVQISGDLKGVKYRSAGIRKGQYRSGVKKGGGE